MASTSRPKSELLLRLSIDCFLIRSVEEYDRKRDAVLARAGDRERANSDAGAGSSGGDGAG